MNGDRGAYVSEGADARPPGAVPRNRTLGAAAPAWTPPAAVARNRFSLLSLVLMLVLMLGAACGLVACTGPTAPVGTVPGSTVTSTAHSASATPEPAPTRPAEKPTPDSAIDFVRYFWALYNYAYQTYDTKPLEAISDKKCSFCSAIAADVTKISEAHSSVVGYQVSLPLADSPPGKITRGTLVIGTLSQHAGRLRAADGSVTDLPGFKSIRSTVAARWDGLHWHVAGVTNDPKTRKSWES